MAAPDTRRQFGSDRGAGIGALIDTAAAASQAQTRFDYSGMTARATLIWTTIGL